MQTPSIHIFFVFILFESILSILKFESIYSPENFSIDLLIVLLAYRAYSSSVIFSALISALVFVVFPEAVLS